MFTGLVEELGKVKGITRGVNSVKLTITATQVIQDMKIGDSIAVNGTCLTVVAFADNWFTADVMPETVKSTVLASFSIGDIVNLERTLRVGDRFGGHIVSGHVDGTGTIIAKEKNDNAMIVRVQTQPEIMRYIVKKGSIAIDGISLTVVECDPDGFSVSLIPHSVAMTTLGFKKVGSLVNLEVDVIGKYVEKLLGVQAPQAENKNSRLSTDFLQQHGFTV